MASPSAAEHDWTGHPTADRQIPVFVDWILGTLVALGGSVSIVGGSALVFLVDQNVIAEGIEDGTVTLTVGTTELTGLIAVGRMGVAIVVGAGMFFAMMVLATIGAVLGALGGYVGGRFAESQVTTN